MRQRGGSFATAGFEFSKIDAILGDLDVDGHDENPVR